MENTFKTLKSDDTATVDKMIENTLLLRTRSILEINYIMKNKISK